KGEHNMDADKMLPLGNQVLANLTVEELEVRLEMTFVHPANEGCCQGGLCLNACCKGGCLSKISTEDDFTG
ncbi:MAG: hypothetical protein ABSH32_17365, partial [Bryobacteraceae bacterium]